MPELCVYFPEVMAFSCFTELMKRMNQNFPHGGAMDSHFANMRSLIQVCICTCTHMNVCSYKLKCNDETLFLH